MNHHANAIANRLSLRQPQRESLEILARVCDLIPLEKSGDLDTALQAIQSEFPSVTDFEREFPSLCFALATGVGKTRLAIRMAEHLAQEFPDGVAFAPLETLNDPGLVAPTIAEALGVRGSSGQSVAAVYVLSHHTTQYGCIPLPAFVQIAHARGIPVIVDAAAEEHRHHREGELVLVRHWGGS